mgnify:FL=1|jgi:hypothetical protein
MVAVRAVTDLIVKHPRLLRMFADDTDLPETFSTYLSRQMFFGDPELRNVAI